MSRIFLILAATCLISGGIGYAQNANNPRHNGEHEGDSPTGGKASGVDNSEHYFKAKNDASDAREDARYKLEQAQADAEAEMAYWTKIGSVVASVSIILLIFALGATIYQNIKLAETNGIMREQHAAEQRPWLSVKIDINNNLKRGLVNNADGYILDVICSATNHGPSPAVDVLFHAELWAPSQSEVINPDSRIRILKKLSSHFKSLQGPVIGQAVFPENTGLFEHSTAIQEKAILEAAVSMAALDGKYGTIVLGGLIQYKSATCSDIHQTRFAYLLGEIITIGGKTFAASGRVDKDLSLVQIGLQDRSARIEAD